MEALAINVLKALILQYRMSVADDSVSMPSLSRESTASSASSGHAKKYSLKIRRETFAEFYMRLVETLKRLATKDVGAYLSQANRDCFLTFLAAYPVLPAMLDSPQALVGFFSQIAAKRQLNVASTTRDFLQFILRECSPDMELASTFAQIRDSLNVPEDKVNWQKLPSLATFQRLFGKDDTWVQSTVAQYKNEAVGAVYFEVFEKAVLPFTVESFPSEKAHATWMAKNQQERLNVKSELPKKGVPGANKRAIPLEPFKSLTELSKLCIEHCLATTTPLDEDIRKVLNQCSILWLIDPFSEACHFLNAAYQLAARDKVHEVALLQVFTVAGQLVFERKYYDDVTNWPKTHQDSWSRFLSAFYALAVQKTSAMMKTLETPHRLFDPLLIFVQSNVLEDPLFKETKLDMPKRLRHYIRQSAKRMFDEIPEQFTGFLRLDTYLTKITTVFPVARKTYKHEFVPGFKVAMLFAKDSYAIASNLAQECFASKEAPNDIRELSSIVMNYSALKLFAGFKDYTEDEKVFYPYAEPLMADLNRNLMKHITRIGNHDNFEKQSDEVRFSGFVIDLFDLCKTHRDVAHWRGQNLLLKAKVSAMIYEGIADAIIYYCNIVLAKIQEDLQAKVQNTRLMSEASITEESCVALNNLNTVLKELDALEEGADLDILSEVLEDNEKVTRKRVRGNKMNLTVSVLSGEIDVPATATSVFAAVSVADKRLKTQSVPVCATPRWTEELEFEIANPREAFLLEIRDEKQSFLDTRFIPDLPKIKQKGVPMKYTVQDRVSQAKLHIEVFLEDRKQNPVFFMGRARRVLLRSREICLSLFALKLCAPALDMLSLHQMDKETVSAMFSYLDQNLAVLAESLTLDTFHDVKNKTWDSLYGSCISSLLPSLDELGQVSETDTLIERFMDFGGFGRKNKVDADTLVEWLADIKATIYGMTDDKADDMAVVSDIAEWYDTPTEQLKQVFLEKKKFMGKPVRVSRNLSRRTSMKMGSLNKRRRDEDALKKQRDAVKARETCERILQVLLAKGEKQFVRGELARINDNSSSIAE